MLGAGAASGAANAVAGGGSALSFPVLVLVGVPPVAANATNSLGLWPGGVAAAWSYRSRIGRMGRRSLGLMAPALAGGLLGAWLLIRLPATWFGSAAPYLVMAAATSVAIEPLVRAGKGTGGLRGSDAAWVLGMLAMFGVALYGGYFGAGMGLLMLSTLGLLGFADLQQANAVKNLLAVAIKLPAVLYFMAIGAVRWDAALLMGAGAMAGGWLAGLGIQRVDAERLRWLIASIGLFLGVLMLLR